MTYLQRPNRSDGLHPFSLLLACLVLFTSFDASASATCCRKHKKKSSTQNRTDDPNAVFRQPYADIVQGYLPYREPDGSIASASTLSHTEVFDLDESASEHRLWETRFSAAYRYLAERESSSTTSSSSSSSWPSSSSSSFSSEPVIPYVDNPKVLAKILRRYIWQTGHGQRFVALQPSPVDPFFCKHALVQACDLCLEAQTIALMDKREALKKEKRCSILFEWGPVVSDYPEDNVSDYALTQSCYGRDSRCVEQSCSRDQPSFGTPGRPKHPGWKTFFALAGACCSLGCPLQCHTAYLTTVACVYCVPCVRRLCCVDLPRRANSYIGGRSVGQAIEDVDERLKLLGSRLTPSHRLIEIGATEYGDLSRDERERIYSLNDPVLTRVFSYFGYLTKDEMR